MIPNNHAFMALAREHCIPVADGGDERIHLLPSLLVTVEEIARAVSRLAGACEAERTSVAKAG